MMAQPQTSMTRHDAEVTPARPDVLQRCACGGRTSPTGECAACRRKRELGLQAKLVVNEPGDRYEREADRAAGQVMRRSSSEETTPAPVPIQRVNSGAGPAGSEAPPVVHEVLRSPGQPLDTATRSFMETGLGYDFGTVRVHANAQASESARAVGARAFTVGHDVVFGNGEYAPGTEDGRWLLAHELAHTVQQRFSTVGVLARVVDPVADKRLQQVLIGQLHKDRSRPASTAGYFFQLAPPQATDASKALSVGPSLIDAILGTVSQLRRTLSLDLREPSTPPGDVKMALSDVPDGPASAIVAWTAKAYDWDVEVMVPELVPGGVRGRPAVDQAAQEGRPEDVGLTTHDVVAATAVKLPKLAPGKPCTRPPPDQVEWIKTPSGKVHIDVGGEGAYPHANNLNWVRVRTVGPDAGDPIPNLICANINATWPIGDRRIDLITVESSPFNPTEMNRVIKPGGRIEIRTTAGSYFKKQLTRLERQLAGRIESIVKKPDDKNPNAVDITIIP